jgi:uncharacterized membrane protein YjgN (DUF898 family)
MEGPSPAGSYPVTQPIAPPPSQRALQPLRFTGSGSGYFGIWIVNLLLTILTIGIYSPWAKVRRLQYFYRHTEVADSSFDFHGSPVRILVGRVLALAMLLLYNISVRLHSVWTLIVVLALAAVMPWLLRNSFRFRLYNSSWRGTRFHFRGSVASAYRVFLLNGFLTVITLYLFAPFMHQRLKAYQHGNSYLGRTPFSFHARVGQFYLVYLLLLAAIIAVMVALGVSGIGATFAAIAQAQQHGGKVDPRLALKAVGLLYAALIVLGVSIGPAFQALITNLIWNNTRLGEHRFTCTLSPWVLIWISVSNLVLVLITLGLFIPWAMTRMTRYRVESVQVLPASDLQEFVAAEPETIGAVGEEAATVFDFDISL